MFSSRARRALRRFVVVSAFAYSQAGGRPLQPIELT